MRSEVLDMKLIKYKLGELITLVDERNNIGIRDFYGVNIHKDIVPTIAKTADLDEQKYKLLRKNRFVFSGMQTGRDKSIRISLYQNERPVLISPAYTTFEVKSINVILPEYFFMLFLTKEKDRLGWFYSDSSIRSNLDWNRFIDIDIELPPIEIQQKYVNIYKAMLKNQENYERGLDDLKSTVFMAVDKFKDKLEYTPISELFEEVDERNENEYIKDIKGLNINKSFILSTSNSSNVNIKNYKVVKNGEFAFSGMQTGRDRCIRIALNDKDESIIISPAYSVFRLNTLKCIAEYIMIWFERAETDRYGWFVSDSSVRSNLDYDRFAEIKIPIPDIHRQQAIVDIYKVYKQRKTINEKLKSQIKDICPILIKGSVEEARAMMEG